MMAFLLYLLKASLALAMFYLFYRVALRDGTLLRLNRAVLLGATAASFVLPCAVITFHRSRTLAEVTQVADLLPATQSLVTEVFSLPTPTVKPALWLCVVALIYIGGVCWVSGRLLSSILSVLRILRSGERVSCGGGINLVVIDADIIPFSWMRNVVLSRADWLSGRREIFDHECAHVRFHHSSDLLLVDMAAALQWFNPFIWMLREDLCAVHEFQADAAVLERGADRKGYLFLLVQKAAAVQGYTIANSFSSSILKNRFRMMLRSDSNPKLAWRLLLCVPLLGLVMLANARMQTDGFASDKMPFLLFDRESVSWDNVALLQDQIREVAIYQPEDVSRYLGHSVAGGVVSLYSHAEQSGGIVTLEAPVQAAFSITDPDFFPLFLVNGVEFPYLRRNELNASRWEWKWYAYLRPEEAVPIYGAKALNGALIVNVVKKPGL